MRLGSSNTVVLPATASNESDIEGVDRAAMLLSSEQSANVGLTRSGTVTI